jgi:hypothetical protein
MIASHYSKLAPAPTVSTAGSEADACQKVVGMFIEADAGPHNQLQIRK